MVRVELGQCRLSPSVFGGIECESNSTHMVGSWTAAGRQRYGGISRESFAAHLSGGCTALTAQHFLLPALGLGLMLT